MAEMGWLTSVVLTAGVTWLAGGVVSADEWADSRLWLVGYES